MTLLSSTYTGLPQSSPSSRLQAWVTKATKTPTMGIIQAPFYFARAHVHVTEAFNSDGTDTLVVGYSTDTDAFVTTVDVSTTGVKSVTLGTLQGYNSTNYTALATYTAGGTDPTTGKALVILEFFPVKLSP